MQMAWPPSCSITATESHGCCRDILKQEAVPGDTASMLFYDFDLFKTDTIEALWHTPQAVR